MKPILVILSLLGLALTVVPAFLVFAGTMTWLQHASAMVVGAILWFAAAPL